MCAVCHGQSGQGYVADNAPALANAQFQASVTDAFLRTAIIHGRRDTTMSPWATSRGGPLSSADVDAIVAFMRTWHDGDSVPLDEGPVKGDAARGAQVYQSECVVCHGARGRGGPNIHLGDAELLASASNGFLRFAILKGRSGTRMPPFEQKLGAQGVEDVVSFLRSLERALPRPSPPRPSRPPPIPLGPVPLNPKGHEPAGFKQFPETTKVDVVHAQLDKGAKMALLDAREPSAYTILHIAGAVSVPFYDPSPYLEKLPKDAWMVCYCACPHAESRALAKALRDAGFPKVTVLDEGLGVWKSRGFATIEGTAP
jgi:cytochrome c oxidase cbb3-type subunit 3/ubiquinol-cytochrome c reductase cytochrome c subunit